jgi:hypothetical protein
MTTDTNRSRPMYPLAALVTAALLVAGCQGVTPSPVEQSAGASAAASSIVTPSSAPTSGEVGGRWEPAGTMATARDHPHAVALADGRVLVIADDMGVEDDVGAEIWDPGTGAWQTTAPLNHPRTAFAAVSLADGRVLVTGGLNDIQQSYSSAYVYDPSPGIESWMKVGLMDTARTDPTAALLPDGRVLVTGGYFHHEPTYGRAPAPDAMLAAYRLDSSSQTPPARPGVADIVPPNIGAALATAELFDPATGAWSLTGPMNYARSGAAAVTLSDGRILVVGSHGGETGVTVDEGAFDSAEIYDPVTGHFSLAGTLPDVDRSAIAALGVQLPDGDPQPGDNGTLVALDDGGALLVGHAAWWKHLADVTRSFRFDAETASWREVAEPFAAVRDMATDHWTATPGTPRFSPLVAPLADGRVIVAGGDGAFQQTSITSASADIYDPVADTWSPLPPMPEPRDGGTAVALPDGSVLLVGGHASNETGWAPLASATRFAPGSAP